MILILRKDKNILGRIGLHFSGFGEANTFRGQGNYLQGFGEINLLFLGVKGALPPPPPGRSQDNQAEKKNSKE